MNFLIEQAAITQAKAKIAIVGPTGAGKTFTSLVVAQELGENILVIDTENKSSVKFSNQFTFSVMGLPDYKIETYIKALAFAGEQGFDVVIVDSLSHAWAGAGGALEQAEMVGRAKYNGNSFAGWADVTPLHNRLIDAILNYRIHLIATMRQKMKYALVENERGKQIPKKMGLDIIQRNTFEYEFDIIAQMDVEHNLHVTKTRYAALDGYMVNKPNKELGQMIGDWLSDGTPLPPSFATLDDLLFQLHQELGLSEEDAKAKLKKLGYKSWPVNGNARQRSTEMYLAVKRDMENEVSR